MLHNIKDLVVYLLEHELVSTFYDVLMFCIIFMIILVTVEGSILKLKLLKNLQNNLIIFQV